MTLNLLIPVYNDYKGLVSTISSLNLSNYLQDNLYITVINDCSTDGEDYNKIKDLFADFYNIEILQTPENGGPGVARQYGLDHLSHETDYITFIDAGDIVYSSVEFIRYLNVIEQNPDAMVFSAAHQTENPDGSISYTDPFHNRMHGKIFKTSFIKDYNIRFIDDFESSKMNEDIGFNSACRFICDYLSSNNDKIAYYLHYETPIIFWTYNSTSLTRQEDHVFYYRQNWGLAKNYVFAVNQALNNGVPFSIVKRSIYETMVHLYAFYLSAINVKPEYEKEMLDGAFYFYKNAFIKDILDEQLLTEVYNLINSAYVNKQYDPYNVRIPTVSFYDFLLKLEQIYQMELRQESSNLFHERFINKQAF